MAASEKNHANRLDDLCKTGGGSKLLASSITFVIPQPAILNRVGLSRDAIKGDGQEILGRRAHRLRNFVQSRGLMRRIDSRRGEPRNPYFVETERSGVATHE